MKKVGIFNLLIVVFLLHIILRLRENFKKFYNQFIFLENKYSTLPNLYKNSLSNTGTLDYYMNKRKELNFYKTFQSKFTNSIYKS